MQRECFYQYMFGEKALEESMLILPLLKKHGLKISEKISVFLLHDSNTNKYN